MTDKLAELFDEHAAEELRAASRPRPDAWSRASARFLDPAPGGTAIGKSPAWRREASRCAAVALIAVLVAALAGGRASVASKKDEPPPAPAAIEITGAADPSFDHRDPARRRFGMLEFRGGLVLTSPFREFGGISAISVAPDGANFIAATDQSWWLRGRITYDGTRPTGIADAEMAPMLGPDGRTLASRRWYDTEAIAHDGGTLYVGIERVHRIVRFDFGKDGLLARGRPIDVPAALRSLPSNGSIEALVFVPRGAPARRHADRDLRARPRQGRRPPCVPDRRAAARHLHDQAHGTTSTSATPRCCRPAISWCWSASSAGPPACSSASGASRSRTMRPGRAGRRAGAVRGRSRPADRQHGRHQRPPQRRRDRADADLRRQFLAAAAHAAAAVHAGWQP